MKFLKIAGSCVNQTPLDWSGNSRRLISVIQEAQNQHVDILCLPELAISGYGCEDAFFSHFVIEQAEKELLKIAAVCHNIVVSVGLPIVHENCLFNTVCLIQNCQILGFVAKQDLAGDGIHYEPRWFKAWEPNIIATHRIAGKNYPLGDLIFEIDGVRIGFEICEDAWNGVRPAQKHYLNNVDVILNPSASHFAFGKTIVREKLVTEASRSYCCTYVYSNLLGNESGRIIFDGEILISQNGNLLIRNKRFSFQEYQIISTIIDITGIRKFRKKSFNFKPNLNVSTIYGVAEIPTKEYHYDFNAVSSNLHSFESKEEEFYRAEILALFDYMRKSYSRGYVLSLSGGADSSACAVLVAKMFEEVKNELGDNVFLEKLKYCKLNSQRPLIEQLFLCVYQATENSGQQTFQSAKELATGLGAEFYNWNIQAHLDNYHKMVEESIGRELNWKDDDITLQNIQARVRAPGIWMMANLRGGLLITTSNRSEAAVGYATMDGDTCGGLAPLGGIDKAFLIHWLKWAEKNLNIKQLSYVNSLQPTAELRPVEMAQTDETDLMPYPILDLIERHAIRDYQSPIEIFRSIRGIAPDNLLKSYIRKFFTLWARNQWKRERYAPSFHLDDKNLDPKTWCRFPILSSSFAEELSSLEQLT